MSYPVFQCPNCQQYISTQYDACRFCSYPLSDEVKTRAIDKEVEGNRQYRMKMHKGVLLSGLGIFVVGVIMCAVSIYSIFIIQEGIYFPWSPVIPFWGLGQMLIGFNGMRDERKK